jgi:hypothetical protein
VIIAIGYYDLPNLMGIPGEDLPKVSHYYRDAHPCYDREVAIIGGGNSAALAALDLWRHGARVTLVHRGSELRRTIKYWILPDIENRILNGGGTGSLPPRGDARSRPARSGFVHLDDGARAGAAERLRLCPHRLPRRPRSSAPPPVSRSIR